MSDSVRLATVTDYGLSKVGCWGANNNRVLLSRADLGSGDQSVGCNA